MEERPSDRLKLARIARGYKTAKAFADRLEMPQPTYALHETGGRGLTTDAAIRYAELLDVSVDWLLTGRGRGITRPSRLRDINLTIQQVEVVGAVAAGVWKEAVEWPPDERYSLPVPVDPRYADMPKFCLINEGTSMNRLYPDGAVLVCVRVMDLAETPEPGRRVIVYRRDPDGRLEATVKELAKDAAGRLWLWPRSNDPRFQEPWEVPAPLEMDDNEDVKIHALVIGSYQPE